MARHAFKPFTLHQILKAGQTIFSGSQKTQKTLPVRDKNAEAQTCGVDDAVGADGSVRSPDFPLAIGHGFERGHRGWVVDLGAVHASTSGQSHGQRVRVDVAVSRGVQACQHLHTKTDILMTTATADLFYQTLLPQNSDQMMNLAQRLVHNVQGACVHTNNATGRRVEEVVQGKLAETREKYSQNLCNRLGNYDLQIFL